MAGLQEYGIAFKAICQEGKGFENSAHILTNLRKNMLRALDEAVIKTTFEKIKKYLNIMKIMRANLAKFQEMEPQERIGILVICSLLDCFR